MKKKSLIRVREERSSEDAIRILKKAWEELPSDFTFGERSLFVEIAERIIKMSPDSRAN